MRLGQDRTDWLLVGYPTVLTVLRAFPCRSRLGDADTAATVEEEVRACSEGATVALVAE